MYFSRCPLYVGLQNHLNALSKHLYDPQMEVSSVAMEILSLVGSPQQQATDITAKLCSAGVHFLFQALQSHGKVIWIIVTIIRDSIPVHAAVEFHKNQRESVRILADYL